MAGKETEVVAEERTTLGEPGGIELERAESAEVAVIGEAYDPEKIDIVTRGMTIDQMLSRIRAATIDLNSDFPRRRGAWNGVRQSRLIELVLLKIPLPAVYVAEDANENWTVVDGIQHLATIARFVDPDAIGDTPLVMEGLEYLGDDFAGKGFKGLPPRLQRRLKETELAVHVIRHGTPERVKFNIFARLNNGAMPLSAQELRHALTPGPARTILEDWSQGDEFKTATANGPGDEAMADRELVLRFIAFRLTPCDAYPGGDFDQFLGDAMRALNGIAAEAEPEGVEADAKEANEAEEMEVLIDLPADGAEVTKQTQTEGGEYEPEPLTLGGLEAEFKSAMEAAFAIFGDDSFRKRYREDDARNPINKALFEAVAVNLAALDPDQRTILIERRDAVREHFIDLMGNEIFDLAISRGTGDPAKVRTRFLEFENLFKKVLS